MVEKFLVTFIPLFVALDPIGLVPIYLGMSQGVPQDRRHTVIYEAVVTAMFITIGFLLPGQAHLPGPAHHHERFPRSRAA